MVPKGSDKFARRRFPNLNNFATGGGEVFAGRVESHCGDITREVGSLGGHARHRAAACHVPDPYGFVLAGRQILAIRAESNGADRPLVLEWGNVQPSG